MHFRYLLSLVETFDLVTSLLQDCRSWINSRAPCCDGALVVSGLFRLPAANDVADGHAPKSGFLARKRDVSLDLKREPILFLFRRHAAFLVAVCSGWMVQRVHRVRLPAASRVSIISAVTPRMPRKNWRTKFSGAGMRPASRQNFR